VRLPAHLERAFTTRVPPIDHSHRPRSPESCAGGGAHLAIFTLGRSKKTRAAPSAVGQRRVACGGSGTPSAALPQPHQPSSAAETHVGSRRSAERRSSPQSTIRGRRRAAGGRNRVEGLRRRSLVGLGACLVVRHCPGQPGFDDCWSCACTGTRLKYDVGRGDRGVRPSETPPPPTFPPTHTPMGGGLCAAGGVRRRLRRYA